MGGLQMGCAASLIGFNFYIVKVVCYFFSSVFVGNFLLRLDETRQRALGVDKNCCNNISHMLWCNYGHLFLQESELPQSMDLTEVLPSMELKLELLSTIELIQITSDYGAA